MVLANVLQQPCGSTAATLPHRFALQLDAIDAKMSRGFDYSKFDKIGDSDESSDDEDIPTKIEIKKMKPTMLKELLKRRGESSQGSKKELLKRALKSCGYA